MIKNNHGIKKDYVIGLLTGKFDKFTSKNGKSVQVFTPRFINKYRPIGEIAKMSKKLTLEDISVADGLRQPRLGGKTVRIDIRYENGNGATIRYNELIRTENGNLVTFQKNKAEKDMLKALKAQYKKENSDYNINKPEYYEKLTL